MWAGPDLAQKGWADLSPIVLSVFWSGPDPSQTSGLGQHQPDLKRNKTGGGGLFSPSHPHACRTIFVPHAGGDEAEDERKKMEGEEELPGAEEAVPCWSDCFAGSAAVEAGGGVVAHERQLQVAVLLFQAAERERFLLFPSPLVFRFFLSLLSLSSGFSLCTPCLFFLKFPPLFQASPYSFLPLCISFPLFLFSPSSLSFFLSPGAGVEWYL